MQSNAAVPLKWCYPGQLLTPGLKISVAHGHRPTHSWNCPTWSGNNWIFYPTYKWNWGELVSGLAVTLSKVNQNESYSLGLEPRTLNGELEEGVKKWTIEIIKCGVFTVGFGNSLPRLKWLFHIVLILIFKVIEHFVRQSLTDIFSPV
jgi:hypothetical protein